MKIFYRFLVFSQLSILSLTKIHAQNLAPLIPVPSATEIPLLDVASTDAAVAAASLNDMESVQQARRDIESQVVELKNSSGARREDTLERKMDAHAGIIYFFERVKGGDVEAPGLAQVQESLMQERRQLYATALELSRLTKTKKKQARALYLYAHALLFGGNTSQAQIVLKSISNIKEADGGIKARVDLLLANFDPKKNPPASLGKGSTESKVAIQLLIARRESGLNLKLQRSRAPQGNYKARITAATTAASTLSAKRKRDVLLYSHAMWKNAEGNKINYGACPIKLSNFTETREMYGIVERAALQDFAQKNYDRAAAKYSSLGQSLGNDPLVAAIDLRIIQIQRAAHTKTPNLPRLEKTLLTLGNKYKDANALGEGNQAKAQATSAAIAKIHEHILGDEVLRAKKPIATPAQRKQTIQLIKNYLAVYESDAARKEKLQEEMASLFALNQHHEDAVATYLQLVETAEAAKNPAKKNRYLMAAIHSQIILAHWTEQPPWSGYEKGRDKERGALLGLYDRLGSNSWDIIAHRGLLMLSQGKADPAFQLWTATLKTNANGKHAEQAAGWMLTAYQRGKNWSALEQTARLCLEKNMRPRFRDKQISAREILGTALFEGGKDLFAKSNFTEAAKKLAEFTRDFRSHPNRDEGMVVLAKSYHNSAQYRISVQTLYAFLKDHPQSKFRHDVLLMGGDWCVPLAYEEGVLFFYDRFLKQFPNDKEEKRVMDQLSALLSGRGLYTEYAALSQAKLRSNRYSAEEKSEIAAHLLSVLDKNSSLEEASRIADGFTRSSQPQVAAAAWSLKARLAYKNNRESDLLNVERRLAALDASRPEVIDALAETRFLIAERIGQKAINDELFNLGVKDANVQLNSFHQQYDGIKRKYLAVCVPESNGYCPGAYHELARVAEKLIQELEELTIAKTLGANEVNAFTQKKEQLITSATQDSEAYDQKAYELVKQGNTDPDWTTQILWQNSQDWNFERVSGETGNVYVQF